MSLVLQREPRTDDELYYLVQALWGHTIPRHKVCPEHDAPFDAFATAYFNREPQILIHGSRGLSGKSRLLSILGLTKAAVQGSDVNILGGSLSQSHNIHQTMRDAWDSKYAPRHMISDESMTLIKLANRAKIRPLTASQKTVRGPHPATLLLDEIDEMDEGIFDAAKGQPMPQKNWRGETIGAHTAMASTWQYPDKVFSKEYARFQEEELPIFTWCFKDTANEIDGWLDPSFIEQKRREIPAEMWRVEYELGEPSIGNRAFDHEAVERTFSITDYAEGEHFKQKKSKDYEEYRFEEYRRDTDYVVAADWAKEQDFTVITVYAVSMLPVRPVYWMRMRRRPYPVMVKAYNELIQKYNAQGIHDATGLGNVINDYLDSRARGFLMTGAQRDNMLSEYISAVENDKVRAPRIASFYKAHLYCSVEQVYARGKEFHLPDEVCSMALGWKLVSNMVPAVNPVILKHTEDPNWMDREMRENHASNRKNSSWTVGEVRNKSQEAEQEFSLMV